MKLEDGIIRFTLQGETETHHEVDALIVVTVADEVVRRHGLATEGDKYVLTVDFLRDLAIAISGNLDLPKISTGIAVKLWHAAQQEVYNLKKNTSAPQSLPAPTESTPSS